MDRSELITGKELMATLNVDFSTLSELFKQGKIDIYDRNICNIRIDEVKVIYAEYEDNAKFDWIQYEKITKRQLSQNKVEQLEKECKGIKYVNRDIIYAYVDNKDVIDEIFIFSEEI